MIFYFDWYYIKHKLSSYCYQHCVCFNCICVLIIIFLRIRNFLKNVILGIKNRYSNPFFLQISAMRNFFWSNNLRLIFGKVVEIHPLILIFHINQFFEFIEQKNKNFNKKTRLLEIVSGTCSVSNSLFLCLYKKNLMVIMVF